MVPAKSFAGQRVAVFGLGRSGQAAARALVAGGAKVLALDDDPARLAELAEEGIEPVDLRTIDWSGIAALVLSPGVPLTHPAPHGSVVAAQAAGVEVMGDTEIFERERAARAPGSRLVAITGTNGKSTTTALIAHVLRELGDNVGMGGNIGTPILALDDVSSDTVYVVEYSSYQIDLTPSLRPDVGILLNLSEDHLDRHGSFAHYAEVKARLVEAAARDGVAVVGVDDAASAKIAASIETGGGRLARISHAGPVSDGVFATSGMLFEAEGGLIHEIADIGEVLTLKGAHNWQNAAAAVAAARALGHGGPQIATALAGFGGLAHRMEIVGRRGAVLFVNDSKATNADAAARALASFKDIYWIAGGIAKAGGIMSLAPYFPRIRHAFLIGEAAESFAKTLRGKVPFTLTGDLVSAVRAAAEMAAGAGTASPVVLLSPASASFDQFANFEARGDAFREAVAALGGVTQKPRS